MTLVLFLAILALLVFVHELGHFSVAKYFGIRVDEFGFGFPPRLASWVRGETRYSINLIPFGGFVKIFGEDGSDAAAGSGGDEERSFVRKSRLVQAAVLVAGVAGNFLLAWLLISAGFMAGLPASADGAWGIPVQNPTLTIVEVLPDSPASRVGIEPGESVVSLAQGARLLADPDADAARAFIAQTTGALTLTLRHGEQTRVVSVSPAAHIVEGVPAIGVALDMIGTLRFSPPRALWEGAKVTAGLTAETARALARFFRDAFTGRAALANIAGPVGIAGLVGEARALGATHLLSLTALISINLALINLIPFPALDGGRLLFVAIEALRRKPLPHRVTQTAHSIGFAILLVLLLAVTYHDLLRLFTA